MTWRGWYICALGRHGAPGLVVALVEVLHDAQCILDELSISQLREDVHGFAVPAEYVVGNGLCHQVKLNLSAVEVTAVGSAVQELSHHPGVSRVGELGWTTRGLQLKGCGDCSREVVVEVRVAHIAGLSKSS